METEETARHLVQLIVSKIDVYKPNKSGTEFIAEIEEARTLFESHVVPALAPLFDEFLTDRGLAEGWQSAPTSPALSIAPPEIEAKSAVPVVIARFRRGDRLSLRPVLNFASLLSFPGALGARTVSSDHAQDRSRDLDGSLAGDDVLIWCSQTRRVA